MKIWGVTGWKNSGKTTLVERLVREFTERGLVVSTLKHAHESFDIDQDGRDTARHSAAGARQVLVSSPRRWALMHELGEGEEETAFQELTNRVDPVDLLLVEGFKAAPIPKIETIGSSAANQPLIAANAEYVRAFACDGPAPDLQLPVFGRDDVSSIADFILQADTKKPKKSFEKGCFALPPGVDWMPVDEAQARLKEMLGPTCERATISLEQADGRILAKPVAARRANPPVANAAVDGFGYAHASLDEAQSQLPLVDGRSAAGAPFDGDLPFGKAVHILTGASLPSSVDTVILQEEVEERGDHILLKNRPKAGANTREAGEDVAVGAELFAAGHRISPPDLALMAATGTGEVEVYEPLRVGVLSTGDELLRAGQQGDEHSIYDANRPMLLSTIKRWGFVPVDLGIAPDDRGKLRHQMEQAAHDCDVILTSGGASAGAEDHLSALMREEGEVAAWRIALKPGRPLMLGRWQDRPVFGLPGNPVAAFVCTLIFVYPSLHLLAGAGWRVPHAQNLPAAFSKSKKPGRREYLRARLNGKGQVEVFASEGSGRISGLSWAEGLVELPDEALEVTPGNTVRYLPFSGFGL